MNYLKETLQENLLIDMEFYQQVYEQMEVESDFITSCFENNIILEAGEPKTSDNESWVTKLKELAKKILNSFVTNAKRIFGDEKQWLEDNEEKIMNANYTNMSVTMLPYWNGNLKNMDAILNQFVKALDNPPRNMDKASGDRTYLEQNAPFKSIVQDKNKSFAENAKDYFRVGANAKAIELKGNALKSRCTGDMLPYVKKYVTDILPKLQKNMSAFDRALSKIENELKKRPTTENFCLVENCLWSETDLQYCYNYSQLTEAEQKAEPKTETKTEEKKDENKPVLNKVTTSTTDKLGDKETVKSMDTTMLKYYKNVAQLNQITIAAAMTASEECFRAYMQVLKGVAGKK